MLQRFNTSEAENLKRESAHIGALPISGTSLAATSFQDIFHTTNLYRLREYAHKQLCDDRTS